MATETIIEGWGGLVTRYTPITVRPYSMPKTEGDSGLGTKPEQVPGG